MSLAFNIPKPNPDPVISPKVETDKSYTLFYRGAVSLNWDDLDFLRDALATLPPSRNTYINYNEEGIKFYNEVTA